MFFTFWILTIKLILNKKLAQKCNAFEIEFQNSEGDLLYLHCFSVSHGPVPDFQGFRFPVKLVNPTRCVRKCVRRNSDVYYTLHGRQKECLRDSVFLFWILAWFSISMNINFYDYSILKYLHYDVNKIKNKKKSGKKINHHLKFFAWNLRIL